MGDNSKKSEKIIIIGAGPAGLTAAYELVTRGYTNVVIFEESDCIGGISKTVNYKGNRMDMGGHRFFSKDSRVNEWWERMLPLQGDMPIDDKILERVSATVIGGPNPDTSDQVMLRRNRVSRIYYNKKFFEYPVSLKLDTIKNMGFITIVTVGFSYIFSLIHKRNEKSLEDFYINRFGKKLYSMFFENYTENVWGRHPREISPEWGAQRVKGLSIMAVLNDVIGKTIGKKDRKVETSLIEEFSYPKYGPGQLWELTAQKVEHLGGQIIKNGKVVRLLKNHDNNSLNGIAYEKDGEMKTVLGDHIISSMQIKDLVKGLDNVPKRYLKIAEGLSYRDYITVGVLVKRLLLKNQTKIKTIGNIIPDNWVYVHDSNVKMGRFQLYNNWSPYMVNDIEHSVWLGLEYFCNEGDDMWSMSDDSFADMAVQEMLKMGLIMTEADVIDRHVERIKKAYPAYFDTYKQIDELREWINTIPNLYCVGRNGQHRYNNMDHSMCTSFEAVDNIVEGITTKDNIWSVNTEMEYHETGNRC